MPRGATTRKPSRTGRHEKAAPSRMAKAGKPASRPNKSALMAVVPAKAIKHAKALTKAVAAAASTLARGAPPKGYNPLAAERVREILKRLDATYPNAVCALHHNSAWELLVATILSAQCTDARVNMVTPVLFEKYPTIEHFAALEPADLEDDIRSTGFFRNKSKSLAGAAKKILGDFGGQVPRTMDELLQIPGVARKTANVVLGSLYGIADGVVVDTHVQRISRRLELTQNSDPQKIEQDLMKVIPQNRWIDFSHEIIHHGRAICIARKPKCAECPLENLCHAADKTWSTVAIHKNAVP